ncbi:hypothetical protein HU200_029124 [Digitaria exilis]|uniref:DUF1618 domain-containing protein n=1 Tax=Digitaria exilis TaxID=1010633 RepID=A0A835EUW8_9POAL|nr:hypothetical protein HU200_029124 [Digitaria exilis]
MQKESTYANVLAAHGDSLVIYVYFKQGYENQTIDYFVYNAGDASGEPPRPPSLLLLPPLHVDERWLDRDGTGVLRRGEDEIVVAELKLVVVSWDTTSETKEAELRVVRSAQWSWSVVKRAAVVVDGGGQDRDLLSLWKTDTVFPIGEAQLCWVDLYRGLLFCSIFDENPMLSSRGVSVTSAGSTVKFVGVFPRCCCGGTGATHCRRSHHAYIIKTWTLRMDDMVWVMDGLVDATQLWALDAYKCLPQVPPVRPVVNLDDPYTIRFILSESYHVKNGGDVTEWVISIDMRQTLLSVSHHFDGLYLSVRRGPIPSRVSCYLDPNSSRSNCASPSREGHIVVADELQKNVASHSPELVMQVSVILDALQEISSYRWNHDDMLKAYKILSKYDSHSFRALLELPKNIRKDRLLLAIKGFKVT